MTLTMDVASDLLGLEQLVAAHGWDNGVGLWAIHPQHDSGELTFEKLGGADYPLVNPVELLTGFPPPPECYAGLIVSFEAWVHPDGVSDRVDVRYVIAVLRSQTAVVIEHIRDRKPVMRIAPADRPMAGNESCLVIVSMMRRLVTTRMPGVEVHVVPIDADVLRHLFGGE